MCTISAVRVSACSSYSVYLILCVYFKRILKFSPTLDYLFFTRTYMQNFGLYGERVGALSVVTSSKEETERVLSQVR